MVQTTEIKKVLVANRGEIAVRIIRACRDLGLVSVAVHAREDASALHVRMADEAHLIMAATPVAAYLDHDALVSAALASGADTVHPGYGFLAEDAEFASKVGQAGLTWVGPSPEVIGRLGDKVQAREVAISLGVTVAGASETPVTNLAEALPFLESHGLPVLVKAVHGGGGRGMRVVRDRDDLASSLEAAMRESQAVFGRDECFLEEYLERPRHIETQCLADAEGRVVVLSTRECSVQRRHQKLLEEAPAPWLPGEVDAEIRRASKTILGALGYVGAGTCEFLVTGDRVTFLEVNTRLQVEHPVTEEVTGIDVVAEMFRIASGEPLGYDDPPVEGHAIELRINAEDARAGFLPSTGLLRRWTMPTGPGVRIDAGYAEGDEVSADFDPLLAKLIVWGRDRDQAIRRCRRALAELSVVGVSTLRPLFDRMLCEPDFVGDDDHYAVHTQWLDALNLTTLPAGPGPDAAEADLLLDADSIVVDFELDGVARRLRVPSGLLRASMPVIEQSVEDRPASRRPARVPVGAVLTPMQGTIVEVKIGDGDIVDEGQVLAMLEAMKMEQPVFAPAGGLVQDVAVTVGASVKAGAVMCRIVPA